MSNQLLTISQITREALRVLENNLTFTAGVNRNYDDQFAKSGAKIGDTINVRKPPKYVGRSGQTLSVENQTENSVPVQLNTQFGVDLQFTSVEMALSLDDFSQRVLKPAMACIANKIDRDGLTLYKDVFNAVGTVGTIPTTLRVFLDAAAKQDLEGTPRDGLRSLVIDPLCQASIVDNLKGLFQSGDQIMKQYETGNMGQAAGYKWSMDQNVNSHVVGPLGGSPLVNGNGQSGASLSTKGWTAAAASRLKKGDIFTIAAVNAVNPQSRQSTSQLRQFVATSDFSSAADGTGSVSIYPSITASGQFQTVDAAPIDGAAITVLGNANTVSPAHLAYHRDAFVLAMADLPLPGGVHMASRISDNQLGVSMRVIQAYDISNDRFPMRFDVLYGWKTVYPELACRIMG